jgi:hypothetical protein
MEVAKLNLNLGSAQREFLFRKGTVDEGVIVQVLKTSAYELGRLRRGPELAALYERLVASGKSPLIVVAAAGIGASALFFAYKFPKARVLAFEADAAKFQLLTANTAGLPVECVQATVSSEASGASSCVTVNDIYEKMTDAVPFVVKFDVETGDLFAAGTEWIDRTPVIVAALGDCLVPGTANSRAFVQVAAGWNRDFVYLHDIVFSIGREAGLLSAAA